MRLLQIDDNGNFSFTKNLLDPEIPLYAILSHTWGKDNEEVTFQDIENGAGESEPSYKNKAGYKKILFCLKQAVKDGLKYFWVDSCCINKKDSAEVSEAIISMFRWYSNARHCYVYLIDVSAHDIDQDIDQKSAFRKSRWFGRGWTLQELLAPKSVKFFSREGKQLGDKNSLVQLICEITGIPTAALQGAPLPSFSVPARISWANGRKTTREEDKAYSLMGILCLNMTPMYGEGKDEAFMRLNVEIEKRSLYLAPLTSQQV
ncbi:HET-domain-containing protein [Acephala macrosclerotiorum]|nr:HET-domain-containing protein [Acephala macrosclerotiorum]